MKSIQTGEIFEFFSYPIFVCPVSRKRIKFEIWNKHQKFCTSLICNLHSFQNDLLSGKIYSFLLSFLNEIYVFHGLKTSQMNQVIHEWYSTQQDKYDSLWMKLKGLMVFEGDPIKIKFNHDAFFRYYAENQHFLFRYSSQHAYMKEK